MSLRTSLGRLRRGLFAPGATGPTPVRAVLAVAMFGAGLAGFGEVYQPQSAADWLDCLFRTGQLVTGQFPQELTRGIGEERVPIPLYLNLARFGLPLLVLWIAASALLKRIRRPLRAAGAGLLRDHLVIAGGGPALPALLKEAKRARRRALVIGGKPEDAAEAVTIDGDPALAATWRGIGLARARAVAILGLDDAAALAAALAAAEVARAERPAEAEPLAILCTVEHADVRALLDAAFRGRDPVEGVVLHAVAPAQLRARALIDRHPLHRGADVAAGEPVHALVVGFGRTGEEIALQILRVGSVAEDRPAAVTVLDPAATRAGRALRERLGDAPPLAAIRFVDGALDPADPGAVAALPGAAGPFNAIYVALADDTEALLVALALRRACARLGLGAPPTYVRQRGAGAIGRYLEGGTLGAVDLTRIHAFGHGEADTLDALTGEALDRRARDIHEAYLATFVPPGAAAGPSARPWRLLGDLYRRANRDQADYWPMRLATLGLAPAANAVAPALPDAVIEAAARTEHGRWTIAAQLNGWRLGARDNVRLRHPDLVPFDALSEAAREKDRAVIRALEGGSAGNPAVAPLRAVPLAATAEATLDAVAAAGGVPIVEATLDTAEEARVLHAVIAASPGSRIRLRPAPDLVARAAGWADVDAARHALALLEAAEQVLWRPAPAERSG